MITRLLLSAAFICLCHTGYSQNVFTTRGYLIHIEKSWFFQPCKERDTPVLQSINGRSWRVICGSDTSFAILRKSEDTLERIKGIDLYYRWEKGDTTHRPGRMHYLFCSMTYRSLPWELLETPFPKTIHLYAGNAEYWLGRTTHATDIIAIQ